MEQPRPATTDGTTVSLDANPIDTSLDELAAPQPANTPATPPSSQLQSGRGQSKVAVRGWAAGGMQPMTAETTWSKTWARIGGTAAIVSMLAYATWRVLFTLPTDGPNQIAAWALLAFEVLPVTLLIVRTITLWNIDTRAPKPVTVTTPGYRCVVMIPTYNEPVEVIAPTIAASCALQPAHQTWVLDDGDREWVAQLCATYGARYVTRKVHNHAKAGNLNHALQLLTDEIAAGAEEIDVIAVLDCDHVPLPHFLTATLGCFDDPELALVQAPQNYYNSGAFDDDGDTGEQGMFFHVQLAGRNHDWAGPFWCGSTSLIRRSALEQVGRIATDTIVEDMHTTLGLIRAGWKTTYHHQVLAVGLAPATAEQYLLQRRRWGLGSMQVLVKERLWAAKRWLSWRNFYEYLDATIWWLEGVVTVGAFLIPAIILVSGAQISVADPLVFTAVFGTVFVIRLWGVRRLYRLHLHWTTAFALRILRIPVGLSCLWWLLTRRTLEFQVTPKSGADSRSRGRTPRTVLALLWVMVGVLAWALLAMTGLVPWHVDVPSAAVSGIWLLLACAVLVMGTHRIQSDMFASSRRNAHRFSVQAPVTVNGEASELADISVGGAAVRVLASSLAPGAEVILQLPGAEPVKLHQVRQQGIDPDGYTVVSLQVPFGDWRAYQTLSLWLFHTPTGAIPGLDPGVPAVAVSDGPAPTSRTLVRQYGQRQ